LVQSLFLVVISKKRTLFYIDGGRVFVRRPMCTIISAWEQIFVTLKGCNFFLRFYEAKVQLFHCGLRFFSKKWTKSIYIPFLIFGTDVVMIVIVMNVIKHFG